MNCLSWFQWLIVDRPFDVLKQEFKMFAKSRGGYFLPIPPHFDSNDETLFYVDVEQDGNMTNQVRVFSFSEFVKMRITEEFNKVVVCITEKFSDKRQKNKEEYSTAISQIDSLIFLNEKTEVLDERELLAGILNDIREFLITRSNDDAATGSTVSVYTDTIFGFKGYVPEIKILYNSLESLKFFNSENNQFDLFYQILITPYHTSTMVVNLQPVKTYCDNYKAAYILAKIRPLFASLTFRKIEHSGLICNRLGNPFTESSLSKAKTIFLQRAEFDNSAKDEIDSILNPLLAKR